MNDLEKQSEIGKRIAKLHEIKAELVVKRRFLSADRESLARAGRHAHQWPMDSDEWPSRQELAAANEAVTTLQDEADALIEELGDLGVDESLFRINGGTE